MIRGRLKFLLKLRFKISICIRNYFLNLVLALLLSLSPTVGLADLGGSKAPAQSEVSCRALLEGSYGIIPESPPKNPPKNPRRLKHVVSKLQKEIAETTDGIPTAWNKRFKMELEKLKTSHPVLGPKAEKAWKERWTPGKGKDSLLLDLSHLPEKMKSFLEGPWFQMVGNRGLARPFVSVHNVGQNILIIHHEGDEAPIRIEWADVSQPMPIEDREIRGRVYRVLALPKEMRDFPQPTVLRASVNKLLSGSLMNPNIMASQNQIMMVATLLHGSGNVVTDRPTQRQFKTLLDLIHSDSALGDRVKSLGFYAPTGAGKSRIMGLALIERVKLAKEYSQKINERRQKLLANFGPEVLLPPEFEKKVHIVVAPKKELVDQLALDVGTQLHEAFPEGGVVMYQFGGSRSQSITIERLLEKVKANDEPVVIVTSNLSLNAKLKAWESDKKIKKLMEVTNFIGLDEAHHAHEPIYERILSVAFEQARIDRRRLIRNRSLPLFVLGPTATPFHKGHYTGNIFDYSFWAYLDSPKRWAQGVRNNRIDNDKVMPWVRIPEQLNRARDWGEITAPEEYHFVDPEAMGEGQDSIFVVNRTSGGGYVVNVDDSKLKSAWEYVEPMIKDLGKGVIDARPRDAQLIAEKFSELSGKNFVAYAGEGITAKMETEILKAFRKQTPYEGKTIDGIVGSMKEGMDFPFIGWFISMKKTVKFPENVQAPGRAFRLHVNKLTPQVIFFGSAPEAQVVRQIRTLVFENVGSVPEHMKDSRALASRRRFENDYPKSSLGPVSIQLNTLVEYLYRDLDTRLKNINLKEDYSRTAQAISEKLQVLRSSKHDFEFRRDLREITSELNAFPFFRGNLDETWSFSDEVVKFHKRMVKHLGEGKDIASWFDPLPAEIKTILIDEKLIDMVYEFKAFRNWLGPLQRALVMDYHFVPSGVYEVADAVSAFVRKNGKAPEAGRWGQSQESTGEMNESSPVEAILSPAYRSEDWLSKQLSNILISGSREPFYNRLEYLAQSAVDSLMSDSPMSFEEELSLFFEESGRVPQQIFSRLQEGVYTHEDKMEHVLASRLLARIAANNIQLSNLSPFLLRSIDQSDLYKRYMLGLIDSIRIASSARENEGLGSLRASDVSAIHGFEAIKFLTEMSRKGHAESMRIWQDYLDLLAEKPEAYVDAS